jgi:hypothetical protein
MRADEWMIFSDSPGCVEKSQPIDIIDVIL